MKAVYLYIIIAGYNTSSPEIFKTAMPNFETCQQSVASAKAEVSQGADSENVLVVWCGGADFAEYKWAVVGPKDSWLGQPKQEQIWVQANQRAK